MTIFFSGEITCIADSGTILSASRLTPVVYVNRVALWMRVVTICSSRLSHIPSRPVNNDPIRYDVKYLKALKSWRSGKSALSTVVSHNQENIITREPSTGQHGARWSAGMQAARRAARRPQATRRPQCAVNWDRNLKPKLAIMRQCTSVTDRRTLTS